MTRIPRALALSSFEPGDSPATRQVVRPETASAVSPPRASIRRRASSRPKLRERPRDDEDLSRERASGGGASRRTTGRGPAFFSRARSFRFSSWAKKKTTLSATRGPTSSTADELFGRGRGQRVEGPEPLGEAPGEPLADVADAQGEDEAGEVPRLRGLDLLDEVRGALRPHALQGGQVVGPEGVEVRDLPDEPLGEELVDERFPQAVDVHGPARGEVEDGFPDPGRAGRD